MIAQLDAVLINLQSIRDLNFFLGGEKRCHLFDAILYRKLSQRVGNQRPTYADIDAAVMEAVDLANKILQIEE